MPIRRAKDKAKATAKLSSMVPAGERFITCLQAETGPRSRFYSQVLDPIPGLGLAMVLTRKFYFFTLTGSSVVVNPATRWTNQPGDVIAVFPRDAFPASNYDRTAAWRTFHVHFPNAPQPVKLNVHPMWDSELDQLAAAFPVQQNLAPATEGRAAADLGELPELIDKGLRMVRERLQTSPGYRLYVSIERQLEYLKQTITAGQLPTEEKLHSLTLGVYAAKEFETTDPGFADVLAKVNYLANRMS